MVLKYKAIVRFIAGAFAALVLMLTSTVPALAANYNCGAYSAGSYDNGSGCAAATAPADGGLVNTGERILAFVIPAALILAGTILLLRSRRRMKQHHTLEQ